MEYRETRGGRGDLEGGRMRKKRWKVKEESGQGRGRGKE